MASPTDRAQMLRLALAGWTECEVDPQELGRGGISYTIDTVRNFQSRWPGAELYCLIGADHVPLLPKWREAAELARGLQFLVIPRPGQAHTPFPDGFKGAYLNGVPIGVSSSLIRERVRAGQEIDLLTLPAVAEAIHGKGLYL